MTKKSNNQKRTDFLIECLKICADAKKFREEYSCIENLDYFCNAAAILGYDEEKDEYKEEYENVIEFFNELYQKDAEKYIFEDLCGYNQITLDDYLSIDGYFGKHTKESNQEHRLIAIAFAAAVSKTEN